MAVTIKKIAEICGVSRGTVDRVVNNRGKVKPETEELVRRISEQLGYMPNLAGKALAVRKKSRVIGVLLISEGNAFYDDVFKGIYQAEREIADYGVKVVVKTMKGYDVDCQLKLMEELRAEVDVLIVNPISDGGIASKINELVDSGIAVFTINTDIEHSKRLCYIGSNYIKGGETVCGMLGLLTGGKATIGIVTGSLHSLGHNQRITGFKNICRKKFPDFYIADIAESNDDDIEAFEATQKMLSLNKNINAIFIVAAGVYGVCRAVMSLGLEEKITIVSFYGIPATTEMVKKGLISATICQQPFTQGNKSVHMAFDYLVTGENPQKDQFIVKNEIKIAENL